MEAIKCYVKHANMVLFVRINKVLRLLHIHQLREVAIKKHIIDIELNDKSMIRNNNVENYTNCEELNHETEGVGEIQSRCLVEAFCHEVSFVTFDGSIGMSF